MRLVIAEKPSMARAIAEALGVPAKGRGYLQGDIDGQRTLITWCVGHLVEAAEPEAYGARQWSFASLPILPEAFQFRPIASSIDQWQQVRALLLREDVSEVVNATDAGREGQLIFHLVYDLAGCTRPVRRLWTSSLTDEAIQTAWKNLRREDEFKGLTEAARCRQEADWLVGMNCTRAQTLVARAQGKDGVYSIGRVQTPTLAMLVQRELEIRHFVAKDFWTLQARFRDGDGRTWHGRWFRPAEEGNEPTERFDTEDAARALADRLRGQPAVVERVETKKEKRRPELLYDLTALQREANKRFGFTAERTLELAQELYEAQLISYPRTSSRHLTEEDAAKAPAWLGALDRGPYAPFVAAIRAMGKGTVPKLSKRFVDDKEVEDHSALTVTNKAPRVRDGEIDLPPDQSRIYDLIARRLIAAWFPDRVEQKTTVITAILPPGGERERFRTNGTVVVDAGWSAVDAPPKRERKKGKEDGDDDDGDGELPDLQKGCKATAEDVSAKAGKTSPPRPMSDADLLAAMQGAGKTLDDEALRGAMKDCGLGTPATRANMIETLLKRGYAERRGRALVATDKGIALIGAITVPALKSPELTGQWEASMEAIRRGQAERSAFMSQIHGFIRELVDGIRTTAAAAHKPSSGPLGDCPECGSLLQVRSYGQRHGVSCTALLRPTCRFGFDSDTRGEPTEGRCPWCQGPRRRDRSGHVHCLRCGRPTERDGSRPPWPPLMNCASCRKILRMLWSSKKNTWLLRCDRCDSWADAPAPERVGDHPEAPSCSACGAAAAAIWSLQQRRWLWRCTACSQWAWLPIAEG